MEERKDDMMREYEEYRKFREYVSSRGDTEKAGPSSPAPKDGNGKEESPKKKEFVDVKAKIGLFVLTLLVVVGLASSVANHFRVTAQPQPEVRLTLEEDMAHLLQQIISEIGIDKADSLLKAIEKDSTGADTIAIVR